MYFPAPPRRPGTNGRPLRHGAALKLADPGTWPVPALTTSTQTTRYGTARAAEALPDLAGAPKPGKPGPGRPPGSKNRRPATRHDVGKTVKQDQPSKKTRRQRG